MYGSAPARLAAVSIVAAAVLGGTAGIAVGVLDAGVGAPVVGAVRLAVAGVVLTAAALATGAGADLVSLLRGPSRTPVLVAGAAVAACQVAYFAAISSTGVAVGTVVAIGTTPVACGLLARWWGREPLPRAWPVATACAICGCALMLVPRGTVAVEPAGVALAALAGGSYGLYTVAVHRVVVSQTSRLTVAAVTVGAGGVLLSPILVVDGGALLDVRGLVLSAWVGVVATALAYLLYVRGLARVGAATAGTLALAEPLAAVVLGVSVLGGRPTPLAVAGAALVAVGLVVAAFRTAPASAGRVSRRMTAGAETVGR